MPKCPYGDHEASFTLESEGAPEGARLVVCTTCDTAIGVIPIPQTEIAKKRFEQGAVQMVDAFQELFTGGKKK